MVWWTSPTLTATSPREPGSPRRSAGPTSKSRAGRIFSPSRQSWYRSRAARERGLQAVALAERHGFDHRPILAPALGALAGMAIWTGEFDEAERWLHRAWEVGGTHVDPAPIVMLQVTTGMLHAGRGEHRPALEAVRGRSASAVATHGGARSRAAGTAGWLAATQARLGLPG